MPRLSVRISDSGVPTVRAAGTTKEALLEAIDAAGSAGGGIVQLAAGVYDLSRDGGNSWCADIDNLGAPIVIQGVAGRTILRQSSGMPNAQVVMLRLDDLENVTFSGLIFDGNWGNCIAEIDAISGDQAGTDVSALPSGTLPLRSLSGSLDNFASSGTAVICFPNGSTTTITYTGKSPTSLTGCSGGSGIVQRGYRVLRQNSAAGINHTTQADPKNHGIMVRGGRNIAIERCVFRDMYGDAIWLGISSDDDLYNWARNVKIVDCSATLTARNMISFGAGVERVSIVRTSGEAIWTCPIDSEPQGFDTANRNVSIIDCKPIRAWPAFPGGGFAQAIGVVAGEPSGFNHASAARNWRILDSEIRGWTAINNSIDVVMARNHITADYDDDAGSPRTLAPIFIDHACDDVTIENNYIYDNQEKSSGSGDGHNGAIQIQAYNSGNQNLQPAGVCVRGNKIHARKGVHGIWVNSQGGFSIGDGTAVVSEVSGTASGRSSNTMTDSSKSWTTNQWAGWRVVMGGAVGLIASNTGTVLTLKAPGLPPVDPNGWTTPLGERAATPPAGAYRITSNTGLLNINGNDIDCGADGNAAGGNGVYLFNDRAGSRIRIANNVFRNCSTYGIFVVGAASKPILSLEIVDNIFIDDQATPTMSACIRFADEGSLTSIGKLIMRNNIPMGGVSTVLSNVAAGRWLVNDGDVQAWAGYGAPSHSAPLGSTYMRKDGGASTTLYVNTDGGTTWTPK